MIKAIVSDFSRVLLFPKDKNYSGSLNGLHKKLSQKPGYDPLEYFALNTELLGHFRTLKNNRQLSLFTSDMIQDAPQFQRELTPVFDRIFSASKIGVSKNDPAAYVAIAKELGLSPSGVLYIDDNADNIRAAITAGVSAIQYHNNRDLLEKLGQMH